MKYLNTLFTLLTTLALLAVMSVATASSSEEKSTEAESPWNGYLLMEGNAGGNDTLRNVKIGLGRSDGSSHRIYYAEWIDASNDRPESLSGFGVTVPGAEYTSYRIGISNPLPGSSSNSEKRTAVNLFIYSTETNMIVDKQGIGLGMGVASNPLGKSDIRLYGHLDLMPEWLSTNWSDTILSEYEIKLGATWKATRHLTVFTQWRTNGILDPGLTHYRALSLGVEAVF